MRIQAAVDRKSNRSELRKDVPDTARGVGTVSARIIQAEVIGVNRRNGPGAVSGAIRQRRLADSAACQGKGSQERSGPR